MVDPIEAAARAIAVAHDIDPDEVVDVFGNKTWSWYTPDLEAAYAVLAPILREEGARAMQEAAINKANELYPTMEVAVMLIHLDPAEIVKGIGQ